MMDLRNEMMQTMIECGLDVECQHHEVATAGQSEIDLRFNELVKMADSMMLYKYIIKNVASTTQQDRHVHAQAALRRQRIRHAYPHFTLERRRPLFAGDGYAGLSEMALYAIGGILKHAPSLLAFTQPDHQQLQAAGARLRGTGEPGLLATQSFGGLPHSHVQPKSEGQACRIPLPGSELQSRIWRSRRC